MLCFRWLEALLLMVGNELLMGGSKASNGQKFGMRSFQKDIQEY